MSTSRAGALLGLLLGLLPAGAQAAYICIGPSPRFLLIVDKSAAQFDFYPRLTFAVTPPATDRAPDDGATHTLSAPGIEIPVLLTPKACPILGATLPVTVQLALPDGAATEMLDGCCTLMAQ